MSPSERANERDESDEWLIDAARRAGHKLASGVRSRGTSAWRALLNAGVPEAEVLRLACQAAGTEAADFRRLSPALSGLLPHGVALKHRVAPLGVHDGSLSVATSNPRSPALERELAFAAKQRVRLHAASPSDILGAQAVVYGGAYGTASGFDPFKAQAPVPLPPPPPAPVKRLSLEMTMPDPRAVAPSAPLSEPAATEPAVVPDVTDRLLAAAAAEQAYEAILEPMADGGLLMRLRIDGTLHDRFRVASAQATRVVAALKARTKLDPARTGHTEQGYTTYQSPSGLIAVRMCTVPLRDGRERVVLRLFSRRGLLGLSQLGYSTSEQHHFGQLLSESKGLIVIAGPAGAGTTTTLYAAARVLQKAGRAVSTVENPIDYPLEQIAQVQVSESPHLTVVAAIRAALANTEGPVIIGTPLDLHALEAADTPAGRARLMIGSLNTSDMPAALARLLELHPDRAALASMLNGVVTQRLVRRLCPACAVSQPVSELPEQQQRLLYGLPLAKLRRPMGCPECRATGYKGRTAIAEVVPMLAPLRAAIAGGATAAELAHVARESGMTTLWDSGIARVLEGVTSLAELLDAVAPPEDGGAAPQEDIDALLTQLLGSPHMQPVPVAAPVATPVVAVPAVEPVAPAATEAAAPVAPPSDALRVLLVDDDGVSRRAVAKQLTHRGMRVTQAADGESAVAFAKRLRPDIVLTEVALPRLDVIGLLKALTTQAEPLTVVVHTDQDDDELERWLLEAGARAVLRRDTPADDLVARLRELAAKG